MLLTLLARLAAYDYGRRTCIGISKCYTGSLLILALLRGITGTRSLYFGIDSASCSYYY